MGLVLLVFLVANLRRKDVHPAAVATDNLAGGHLFQKLSEAVGSISIEKFKKSRKNATLNIAVYHKNIFRRLIWN